MARFHRSASASSPRGGLLRRRFKAQAAPGPRLWQTSATVGLVLLVIFGAGAIRELQRRSRVSRELDELPREIATLERGNVELEEVLSFLSSDSYVEAEAKRSLGLGRSGERPVVISSAPAAKVTGAATATVVSSLAPRDPFHAWWSYFFADRT
jgi:cell division protein FtsB